MSEIAICNLALTHIGKPNITNLAEARPEARACTQYYPHVRRVMLQSSAWTFAKKRIVMAEAANDFPERWLHAYARPTGALSILRVFGEVSHRNSDARPAFEVRESGVYTNISPATAEYTHDSGDTSMFSPLFVDALAYRLAEYLARTLSRSPALSQEMAGYARQAMSLAVTADAAQDAPTYLFNENADGVDYTEARGAIGRGGW